MGFVESITIRKEKYTCIDKKGWPLDESEFLRITRLRQKIINQNKRLKDTKESIEYKTKFLDEIYDDVIKKIEKYENAQKRRSGKTRGTFKP